MGNMVAFKTKYLKDGYLSIPKKVAARLSLKRGEGVRVMINKEKFDKKSFLDLFGIWKNKRKEEIDIYREILREREKFGRGEVKL